MRLKKQYGVSLIEVMIGLIITAILFAAGAPSFVTYIQNSYIRNSAEAIQNGLNLARAEAVSRNTHVAFTLGDNASWVVGCESAKDDCPEIIQKKAAAENAGKATVTASEVIAGTGLTESSPLFTSKLAFNGFGRVSTTTLTAGTNAVFDVTDSAGVACAVDNGPRRCLRVEVSPGGQVRMCDPALPGTDPQAC